MAATAATPAPDLLMHTALGQRHILVQVEMLPEGTLAVVRWSMFGPGKICSTIVFPRGSMTRLIRVLTNILRAKMVRSITMMITLSMYGLVRSLGTIQLRWVVNVEHRKRWKWR